MRLFDELEQLALGVATVGHDQLVHVVLTQDARHRIEAAEHGQVARVAVRSDRAEELVPDAAAIGAEHPPQVGELLSLSDEHRSPSRAGKAENVPGQQLVAGAQDADEDRGRHHRSRCQAVGREVVARPEPERERDRRDEHEREDDLADTSPQLTPPVKASDPEHEHRDHRQKRKPLGLGVPDDSPDRRPVAEIELAQDQGDEDAEGQPDEIQSDERQDAGKPPGDGKKRGAREEVRPRGADVLDRPGPRPRLGRHRWLRAHPPECTSV